MLWTSLFVALVLPVASLAAPLRRRDGDDNQMLSAYIDSRDERMLMGE